MSFWKAYSKKESPSKGKFFQDALSIIDDAFNMIIIKPHSSIWQAQQHMNWADDSTRQSNANPLLLAYRLCPQFIGDDRIASRFYKTST